MHKKNRRSRDRAKKADSNIPDEMGKSGTFEFDQQTVSASLEYMLYRSELINFKSVPSTECSQDWSELFRKSGKLNLLARQSTIVATRVKFDVSGQRQEIEMNCLVEHSMRLIEILYRQHDNEIVAFELTFQQTEAQQVPNADARQCSINSAYPCEK
jgi:hypothetical protein